MFVNHPKIKILKNPYIIPELIHYALRKKNLLQGDENYELHRVHRFHLTRKKRETNRRIWPLFFMKIHCYNFFSFIYELYNENYKSKLTACPLIC